MMKNSMVYIRKAIDLLEKLSYNLINKKQTYKNTIKQK